VGAYTYTRRAKDNACNTTLTQSAGSWVLTVNSANTYTGCTTASINLGTVGFTSSATYSRYGLTISSPVTVSYCNNRNYPTFGLDGEDNGEFKADCSRNEYRTSYGSWFTWCMVAQYASKLCPNPWRVPTKDEHCLIVNGYTTDCSVNVSFFNAAGYVTNQYENEYDVNDRRNGAWWTSTMDSYLAAYYLQTVREVAWPDEHMRKSAGAGLRCVK
jgi:hypothetical protein